MTIVAMPDGTRVDFGDLSSDQIRGLIAQKFPDHAAAAQQQDRGWLDAAIGGIARGATFGLMPLAADALGAKDFAKALRDRDQTADVQHPIASGVGEAAGALGSAVVTPELNLFRAPAALAKGAPIAARAGNAIARGAATVGNSAATGAAYTALQGFGEGAEAPGSDNQAFGDRLVSGAESALRSAPLGAAVGAAAPFVGAGVRALGGHFGHPIETMRALRDPDLVAAHELVNAAEHDQGSVAAATNELNRLSAGGQYPTTPLDLGETSRAIARRSANVSPEAQGTLNAALDARGQTQFDRVSDVLRSVAPGINSPETRDLLQAAAKAANGPAYKKAMAEGAGGIWHEGLQQLTASPDIQDAIRGAERTGANKAATRGYRPPQNPFVSAGDGTIVLKPGVKPTLEFWDNVKQNLDGMIGRAARAGDKPYTADLTALKRQLVSYLDEAAPSYKAARGGAHAYFNAEDALTAGENFAKMRGSPQTLHDAGQAIAKMTRAERQLFGEGFASQYLHGISAIPDRNDLSKRIFNSPLARQQFEMALGPQATREMEAAMRVEGLMQLGKTAVQGNSKTVQQLIQSGVLGAGIGVGSDMYFGEGAFNPLNPHSWTPERILVAALTGAMGGAMRRGSHHVNVEVANRLATMLTSQDPNVVRNAYKMIGNNPRMMGALRRGHDRLSRALAPITASAGSRTGLAAQLPIVGGMVGPAQAQQQPYAQ